MSTSATVTIRQCRRCPLRAPDGRCLDTSLKSGRCGDWVWYLLRGTRQCRRRWVKPKDPRTPSQRSCRARLRAASKAYSEFLTDAEQDACIAAAAKVQTRMRAGSSGPLTGHQYWVGGKIKRTKTRASIGESHSRLSQVPPPQRVTRASSGTHRGFTRVAPDQHRQRTTRTRKPVGKRQRMKYRQPSPQLPLQAPDSRKHARSTRQHHRTTAAATPGRLRWKAPVFPALRGAGHAKSASSGRASALKAGPRWRGRTVGQPRTRGRMRLPRHTPSAHRAPHRRRLRAPSAA